MPMLRPLHMGETHSSGNTDAHLMSMHKEHGIVQWPEGESSPELRGSNAWCPAAGSVLGGSANIAKQDLAGGSGSLGADHCEGLVLDPLVSLCSLATTLWTARCHHISPAMMDRHL